MRREVLATDDEADEIALRAVYDERDKAHIAVPRTLSVGISTVRVKVERVRTSVPAYAIPMLIDVGSNLHRRDVSRHQSLC